MNVQVLMYRQDDPKKCTAAKLVKFGLAKSIKKTSSKTLVLNPFANKTLMRHDKDSIASITAIDCSWTLAQDTFSLKFPGLYRILPPLFAGNPVNYSKLNKLTTVEAICGALFILGYDDQAFLLLDKFKWGHTFFDLNQNLLKDFSKISSESQIAPLLAEYGI